MSYEAFAEGIKTLTYEQQLDLMARLVDALKASSEKSAFLRGIYEKLDSAKLDVDEGRVCAAEDAIGRIEAKYAL